MWQATARKTLAGLWNNTGKWHLKKLNGSLALCGPSTAWLITKQGLSRWADSYGGWWSLSHDSVAEASNGPLNCLHPNHKCRWADFRKSTRPLAKHVTHKPPGDTVSFILISSQFQQVCGAIPNQSAATVPDPAGNLIITWDMLSTRHLHLGGLYSWQILTVVVSCLVRQEMMIPCWWYHDILFPKGVKPSAITVTKCQAYRPILRGGTLGVSGCWNQHKLICQAKWWGGEVSTSEWWSKGPLVDWCPTAKTFYTNVLLTECTVITSMQMTSCLVCLIKEQSHTNLIDFNCYKEKQSS